MEGTSNNRSIIYPANSSISLDVSTAVSKLSTVYPKVAFDSKPSITVPRYENVQKTVEAVLSEVDKGVFTKTTGYSVLYFYIHDKVVEHSHKEVKSFAHILSKDNKLHLKDLATFHSTITAADEKIQHAEETKHIPSQYVLLYAGLYRINRITEAMQSQYKTAQAVRLRDQLLEHQMTVTEMVLTAQRPEFTEKEYEKLCALIDLGLSFNDHDPDSYIRWGTTTTRHKDCASLGEYELYQTFLGFKEAQSLEFIYTPAIQTELVRMFDPGNEIDRTLSYMPYLSSLAQKGNSPYSARQNPNYHYLVHLIGCSQLSYRSINARFIDNVQAVDIETNAMWIIWYRRSSTNLGVQFYASREAKEKAEKLLTLTEKPTATDSGQGSSRGPPIIRSKAPGGATKAIMTEKEEKELLMTNGGAKNGLEYYYKVISKFDGVPPMVRNFAYSSWAKIQNPRENSIGKRALTLAKKATDVDIHLTHD